MGYMDAWIRLHAWSQTWGDALRQVVNTCSVPDTGLTIDGAPAGLDAVYPEDSGDPIFFIFTHDGQKWVELGPFLHILCIHRLPLTAKGAQLAREAGILSQTLEVESIPDSLIKESTTANGKRQPRSEKKKGQEALLRGAVLTAITKYREECLDARGLRLAACRTLEVIWSRGLLPGFNLPKWPKRHETKIRGILDEVEQSHLRA